jgi:hypothetical protein
MAGTQIHLIVTVAAAFVSALFGVVFMLSALRRLRGRKRQSVAEVFAEMSDETRPMSAVEDTQQIVLRKMPALDTPRVPRRDPLPEPMRLPVQPGTPEQVVLSIEPVEGPTRDQRNVQKLIDFLKQETVASEPVQKVS